MTSHQAEGSARRPILFLHGLESGPFGSKFTSLSKQLPISSLDCQGLTLEQRVALVSAHIEHEPEIVLVGSSFGGLAATLIAQDHPQVRGLLLLAPAWERFVFEGAVSLPSNTKVIIPSHDEVLDPLHMVNFCEAHHLSFDLVNDTHRLAQSHALIVQAALAVYHAAYGSEDDPS